MFFEDSWQPKGWVDGELVSNLTPSSVHLNINNDFEKMYWRYIDSFGATLRIDMMDDGRINRKAFESIAVGGCIYSAFHVIRGYKNALVIPSWDDNPESRLQRLTLSDEESFLPTSGSSVHMYPLIHFYNECDGKLHIACQSGRPHHNHSFFEYLYQGYAAQSNRINTLRSDGPYVLGDESWVKRLKGHNLEEKYDAVILMDVPHNDKDRFKAAAIKEDFAHLCTDDFDLVQFNTPENLGDRLAGHSDILSHINTLYNSVVPQSLRKEVKQHNRNEPDIVRTQHRDTYGDIVYEEVEEKFIFRRTVVQNSFIQQLNNIQKKIRVY